MKYVDEFRKISLVNKISGRIASLNPGKEINIMEVCGTHTQNFCRFGLDKLLPENIRFISGPGCPVCVSPQGYIDNAIELSRNKDVIIATFGDMLRVPGTKSSLEKEKARFGNVSVVYSPLDALTLASDNPEKKVVFLAVGFETTAPTIALTILTAKKRRLKNISFFSSLKLIPPAMRYLLLDKRVKVDGFLCPGHVSAIIGIKDYSFIPRKYKIPCCVAGFEPLDIMEGIYIILGQIIRNRPCVANQYTRLVHAAGNPKAKAIINRVFKASDSNWRGFGIIPDSGLKIRNEFSHFDTEKIFPVKRNISRLKPVKKCRCPDILKGIISPPMCPLFGLACQPDRPIGPCMVSNEGACNAYYRYKAKS